MLATLESSGLRTSPAATLRDLADHIAADRRSHHDFVARADQLYVDDKTGCLVSRQSGYHEFRLRALATNQLANRLGVPGPYLQKCPPDLLAENVNHWLARQPDRQFLIRCDGDEVRAVLSSRYSPVDHEQIVQWIGDAVGRDAAVRYELNAEQLVVQLVSPREQGTVMDRLHTGISIRNSEVGLSCVEVSGLIYRVICLNGLILNRGQSNYRRRHIGDTSLGDQVRQAVTQAANNASEGLGRFEGTRGVRVPDMQGLFDRVSERHGLSKRQATAVQEAFQVEPGESLYAAINAITRAGNDLRLDLQARRQLQELGGTILHAAESGARWLS